MNHSWKKKVFGVFLACLFSMGLWIPNIQEIHAQEPIYSKAEKLGEENSFRYADGERISSKSAKKLSQPDKVTIIDVSHHQGQIDWEKVKNAGICAVMIRCGYGQDTDENGEYTQDDPYFKYNVSECERLEIPYGIYLYSYAQNTTAAKSEADHVIRLIKETKQELMELSYFQYPIFYDIEDKSIGDNLSNRKISSNVSAFINKMKQNGYNNLGFYANKTWFEEKLTGNIFSLYPKWIAQYNSQCTYTGKYRLWQYTYQASVDGIDGYVDANVKNGSWKANQTVTSISLNKSTVLITVGYSTTVKETIKPTTVINPYIQWKSSDTSVATVSSTGKIVGKRPGKATITATAHNGKKASITVSVRAKSNRITSLKKSGNKSVKISWSKASYVSGYQLYMSTKKSSGYKLIKSTTKSLSYKKSGLKKGKRYYFKVRSYKKVGTKKIYSYFSPVKSIVR